MSLVARETAPMAASREMYSKGRSSKYGPGASGVPGELLGYWEAKKRFGNPDIKWADLVQPAIDLCQKGIAISSALASALHRSEESIRKDPGLREIFIDPDTDKVGGQSLSASKVLIYGWFMKVHLNTVFLTIYPLDPSWRRVLQRPSAGWNPAQVRRRHIAIFVFSSARSSSVKSLHTNKFPYPCIFYIQRECGLFSRIVLLTLSSFRSQECAAIQLSRLLAHDLILDSTLNTGDWHGYLIYTCSIQRHKHTFKWTRQRNLSKKLFTWFRGDFLEWIWVGLRRAPSDCDSPYDESHCPTKLDPFHLRSHSIFYTQICALFLCQTKHGFTRNQVYLYSKQS